MKMASHMTLRHSHQWSFAILDKILDWMDTIKDTYMYVKWIKNQLGVHLTLWQGTAMFIQLIGTKQGRHEVNRFAAFLAYMTIAKV